MLLRSVYYHFCRYRVLALGVLLSSGLGLANQSFASGNMHYQYEVPALAELRADDSVSVELDGHDVSSFSHIDGQTLSLSLATPLAPGQHSLILLLFKSDGDIIPLLERNIEVKPTRGGQWYFNSTFNSSYRLDQKDNSDYQGARHWATNGSMRVSGHQRLGEVLLSADVDVLYDSVSENQPGGDEWALANYLLEANYRTQQTQLGVAAGHIMVNREDLLFSAYQRRGAETHISSNDGFYKAQAFGVHSEPTARFDGQHGIPRDASERTSGISVSASIFEEHLQISVGYIDGETSLGGAGAINLDEQTVFEGDAWNFALDSRWLSNSLWLHLEYAESSFDTDGIGIGEDAENDYATQVLIQLSSEGDIGTGPWDYWNSHIQYQRVGADFFSLGNLSLAGNRIYSRWAFQGGLGGLSVDIEWSDEENNIDDDPLLPTQSLTRNGGTLSYSPMNIDSGKGLWRWLGAPVINTSYYRNDHDQPGHEASLLGFDLDALTTEVMLSLMFSQPTWNWGVQYQRTEIDDRSDEVVENGFLLYEPASDSRNHLTGLQLGWMPSERLSINTLLQWNKLSETDSDNYFRNRAYSIDMTAQLVPDRLSLSMNYNYGRDTSQLDDLDATEDDFRSQFANFLLTWHVFSAHTLSPGLDLYLKGTYGKQDDNAFVVTTEQVALHVGFEVKWGEGQ